MTCHELRDHLELYAIGVVDEPERAEIREHVGRGCEACVAELKRARSLAARLAGMAVPAAPSPKLRRRILASVGAEARHPVWGVLLGALATLCLVAAFYFNGRQREVTQELARARDQMRRQTLELARLNDAFSILNAAGTTVSTFGGGQPKGRVFLNAAKGVLLIASNLPPAPAGKLYEMWVIPKDGLPVRAGMFQAETDGTALHIEHRPVDVASVSAIAVTLEAEAGADQPTSQPLIVAALQ